jgi:hypothetical protein
MPITAAIRFLRVMTKIAPPTVISANSQNASAIGLEVAPVPVSMSP